MAWTKTCPSEEATPFDLIYEALKGFFAALGMVAVAIAIGLWQAGFFQAMYDKRNDTNVAVRQAGQGIRGKAEGPRRSQSPAVRGSGGKGGRMKVKPFPWNPHGFIRPSVEHLFPKFKNRHRNGLPPGHPGYAPKPASNFTITKSNPARTAQISKARI